MGGGGGEERGLVEFDAGGEEVDEGGGWVEGGGEEGGEGFLGRVGGWMRDG